MKAYIKDAIKVLRDGGIVIFPTDTAFGIGCRIDDEKAIEKLFRIRQRPKDQATPVLVDSLEMAKDYLSPIPKDVIDELIKPYWPGGLTIVLPCRIDKVPKLVRGGGKTIGVRIPDNPVILEIIKGVGVPILGPSANFHGEKTPYRFEDLDKDIVKLVDYVVFGECSVKQASTVIDCSINPWKVIRKGAIKIQNSKFKIQKYNSKPKINVSLFIDTSSNKEILIKLKIKKKEYVIKRKIGKNKVQITLPMIDKLLKEQGVSLKDLTLIEVNAGSGSFTGIRVGMAIANALSFALKIPVNTIK